MSQNPAMLQELQDLLKKDQIAFSEADEMIDTCAYAPLGEYLNMLIHRVKPEAATAELFKALADDVLHLELFPEMAVRGGFVDFAIRQKEANPILLELKPAFKIIRSRHIISPETLRYEYHKAQIQKYLLSNEYVILTNLRTVFLFSREALIDYHPFYQHDFVPFLREYLVHENLWDYVRRTEDRIPRKDLDTAFFDDLKKWYAQLQTLTIHEDGGFTKEELIVLFLNKMVFIKTLEDYGLIPFKILEDTYTDTRRRWYVKGEPIVFERFFDEIEKWFYLFYDTELFKTAFWHFVADDAANLSRFRHIFENLMGFGAWQQSFGKGLIHYNYRLIDEDVFGKAYETFLAEHRKDAGVYYTPQPITRYMAAQLVSRLCDPLVDAMIEAIQADEYRKAGSLMDRLRAITVLDPCSGSGSFLIKVLRELYVRYNRIKQALDGKVAAARQAARLDDIFSEPPAHVRALGRFMSAYGFDDPRMLIATIILHHIYAVDVDERALDTAKTNIWKEAVKLEPRAFNFTRLPEDRNHILPSLALNFLTGDSLADLPAERALAIIAGEFADTVRTMHALRDAYLKQPFEPNGMTEIHALKQPILERLKQEMPGLSAPVCMPLEAFFAYFDRDGAPLPADQRGFHGIISNPPWETIKPVRKEFAAIGKGELDIKDFTALFTKNLRTDPEFKAKWDQYTAFYETYRRFLRAAYAHQGSGDLNYYTVFLERDLELTRTRGIVSILIPSGIQTDNGTAGLRRLIFENYTPLSLYSFENRGYQERVNGEEITLKPFPDVDNRFKFSIVSVQKVRTDDADVTFNAKFYLHHPDELHAPPIAYSASMVKKFSPENLSIMEFRSQKDYRLCAKIRGEHPLLRDSGLVFRREFHMTDDSDLFKKRRSGKDDIVLYEGKMIHQFRADFAARRFLVSETTGRARLLGKDIYRVKKEFKLPLEAVEQAFSRGNFLLDYQTYRFVYRAIGSSTNERTLIGTLLPPHVFTGHSLNYLINCSYAVHGDEIVQKQFSYEKLVYMLALFNSLTLNYYIRNKISANLTMNFIYELPIPTATAGQASAILHHAVSLLARHDPDGAFDDLGHALRVAPDTTADPVQLRAALEVLIAKDLYGLTAGDWKYLTATFVYGSPSSPTRQELDQIIRVSREMFGK